MLRLQEVAYYTKLPDFSEIVSNIILLNPLATAKACLSIDFLI